ncbi:MAG TPA: hypothetical protein VGI23_24230 [Steroidobacteraceae bacterium]
MRKLIGLLAVISIASVSPAFATDPPAATTSASSTEAPSTPAKTDQSSASKGITAQTSDGKIVKLVAADADADKQLARLKAAGYKPELHGEELVFCRREAQLGSRFERKVCSTADAIEQQATLAQELTERTQRMGVNQPRGQ